MRIRDYYSAGNTIAASGQSTFTSSQIPSTGLIALHFVQTGSSANSLAGVARIRIKANGQTVHDYTPAQLRAFLQSTAKIPYSPSTVMDANGAGTQQPANRWSIPFCDLTQPTKDMQDQCQFPRGANITVETTYNSGAVAGQQFIGWTTTDVQATCYTKLIGQQMQIAAGSANGRYNFSDEGIVRGIGLPTIGLSRARLVLATAQVFHMLGQATSSASIAAIDNLWVEMDQLWNRYPDTMIAAAGATLVPTTFYNPYFVQVDTGLAAPSGASYLELATDAANWAGPTNEFLLWSQVRQ